MKRHIKLYISIFAMLLCITPLLHADELCDAALQEGHEKYNAGDYQKAKELFEFAQKECGYTVDDWIYKCNEALTPRYTISISDKSVSSDYKGRHIDINVTTQSPTWDYTDKPTWCSITKYLNSFHLVVSENTTNQQRVANIKFYVEGDETILKITQAAAPRTSSGSLNDNRTNNYSTSNRTFTACGVSFTMVYVQGGTFTMGATSEQGSNVYSGEKPTHSVRLSSYYIGETEVTQALWHAVMGSNPSYNKGGMDYPVETVSYDDCKNFIGKLNSITGQNFRLPTEAEWEFAARGGNKSRGYMYAGSDNIGSVAWYTENSGVQTHPVKKKLPNELGLYDMSGNVWEWCNDWFGTYSSYVQNNPQGPNSGSYRVSRGGSYCNSAGCCRVSARSRLTPSFSFRNLGLRLAL